MVPFRHPREADLASGAAIKVENIVKRFGDFEAVKGISLEVQEGETFGLLGPNGAGKSTLIRMMTTLIPITSGRAWIDGHDVARYPDAARRCMGVIPQALTSDINLTLEENLSIYAKLYDVPRARRQAAIDELLEAVDLTRWRHAETRTLSGGMRRRLEIARGLVHSPKIFFLDEPTTGLDPVSRVAVWEMLGQLKARRKLTILVTTHYMDEADRLCDRIAIVDHGRLVALDTPARLKQSVPGSTVIEVQFKGAPADWAARLGALPGVTSVQDEAGSMFRVLTGEGSRTTTELVGLALGAGVQIISLTVQNTTLDDVFVHYTGRQLRDEQVKSFATQVLPQGKPPMSRLLALVERELRKFFRSPALMLTAMVFPLVQLVILGNAFGGNITEARMGVVDYDHGPQARRVWEAFDSVTANMRTFRPIRYDSDKQAQADVRAGRLDAAVVIPPQFSRRVYAGENPTLGLVVDNTDQFMSASLESGLQALTNALNQPAVPPRMASAIALQIVELYPFIEYMKYLLPGSITLAMFVSVMIGGGLLYIDDKARGVHEGWLVTPITKLELVLGLVTAGAIKAVLAGLAITALGSLIAGLSILVHPFAVIQLLLMIVATSFAFNALMFLLMVRVEDPLVPRAMFGILNTLLYFPSGAVYPISSFPRWLRILAQVDPFTYAVHGFKGILLKEAGFAAVLPDILFLLAIGAVALALATRLFKRTL